MSTGPGADSAPAPHSAHDTENAPPDDPGNPGTSATRETGSAPVRTSDDGDADSLSAAVPGAEPAGRALAAADAATTEPATTEQPATEPATPASTEAPGPVAQKAGGDAASLPDAPPGGMFSSLKVRNYRLFATGAVVSNIGTWMSRITQDWLVQSLTHSSAAVGVTTALQFLPMLLFGLYGGVLVDRYPKRRLLLGTQGAMGLCGLVLAALTLSGHVQVWHVYLIAFLVGVVTVVDNPTRQSFVSEMVGPNQVRNAVSLNSANFQTARLVGPAVAGVLITSVGSGYSFLFNGLSFVAPLTGLILMRPAELYKGRLVKRGKGQLREGLRYVKGRPELIAPIVLVGFVGTFGFNFPIWLTAFANNIFHGGAGMYSLFNILMAVGSLGGALLAARRRSTRLRLLIFAAAMFGLLEVAVSFSPFVWLFCLVLVPIGMMGMTNNISANTTVQMASEPAMRGRVMSLYMMVFVGGTPIGGPLLGWVTDTFGARIGFAAGGGVTLLAALVVGFVLVRVIGVRPRMGVRRGVPYVELVPRPGSRAEGELAPVA
ncbi:MFS transporter [Streptomyces sp. DW26H14]|uniref:MFS transporter n=1 Tax=Streptomyces sp. DW26H14 TaxID=3435395 RepID=UPI00403E147C